MQQKVQFIITILHEPKLLIFDEPFSGFDPVNTQLLKEEILDLKNKGATVLFSTHNMSSVEEICDEITLINQSKVVLTGTVNQIRSEHSKGIYLLCVADMPTGNQLETSFNILSEERRNDRLYLKVQKKKGMTTGDLLRELSARYDIRSFKEEVPTMNDIFIQTVQA